MPVFLCENRNKFASFRYFAVTTRVSNRVVFWFFLLPHRILPLLRFATTRTNIDTKQSYN